MNASKATSGLLAILLIFSASVATAQPSSAISGEASAQHAPVALLGNVYIGDFQPVAPAGSPGLVARMHAARDAKKEDSNAQLLADAIVKALQNKGVSAHRLTSHQPIPTSGWMVKGTFQETISHTPFPMVSALIKPNAPNTVSDIRMLSLSNVGSGAMANFSSTGTLKGNGTSFSTNPYKLAAHIVVHRIEADTSMNTSANAIADRIVVEGTQGVNDARRVAAVTP
jgi:hypothetical protein